MCSNNNNVRIRDPFLLLPYNVAAHHIQATRQLKLHSLFDLHLVYDGCITRAVELQYTTLGLWNVGQLNVCFGGARESLRWEKLYRVRECMYT